VNGRSLVSDPFARVFQVKVLSREWQVSCVRFVRRSASGKGLFR